MLPALQHKNAFCRSRHFNPPNAAVQRLGRSSGLPVSHSRTSRSVLGNLLQPLQVSSKATGRASGQQHNEDTGFMQIAMQVAAQAGEAGEVPIGAVMVHAGRMVSSAGNAMEGSGDPTQHAELRAIQEALHILGRHRMLECTLYVTLEPCPMCAGALLQARVGSLVYAARNPLLGADGSWISMLRRGNPSREVGEQERPHPFHPSMQVREGVLKDESAGLMKAFFRNRRSQAAVKPAAATEGIEAL